MPESPLSNSCIIKPYDIWSSPDPPNSVGINDPKQPSFPNLGSISFGKIHV